MFRRIRRFAALTTLGCCFGLVGCQNNDVAASVAQGVKDTASAITGIFFNAAIDRAFQLR